MAKSSAVNTDMLEKAIAETKALLGKDVIRTYAQHADIEVIPTNFYEFNQASSIGGVPVGRVIEIFGDFSSGKTTISWQIAAAMQKYTKKKILFLDYEGSTSKEYLKKLGVNVDEIIFGLPEQASLEDGFTIIDKLVPTEAFCCVIIDSLAAMVPKSELDSIEEKGLEGADLALKAKIMHKAMRKYNPFMRKYKTTLFFINHVMQKINLQASFMARGGDQEETPGGKAVKFFSDMRIQLKPMDFVVKQVQSDRDTKKKMNVKIGRNVSIYFLKNKVGEPFGKATMTLRNGHGFDVATSAIKRALAEGIIVKKGVGVHALKDDETIQAPSYDKFWNLVMANPTLLQGILDKLDGKQVKFKPVDLSTNDRDLSAKELGVEEEEESTTKETLGSEELLDV
jgi:recombination protein RecA